MKVTVLGDSVGRNFVIAFVKLLGGILEFSSHDRHKDKTTNSGLNTTVVFRWHPTAQNLESVSVSESGHGHGDKGPTQLPSSSIVQKKK